MSEPPKPITLRLLDIFRIGIGPSSSHTVGPMRAAAKFRALCLAGEVVADRIEVFLKGSLSATGRGHGTDRAVLAGLHGWDPEHCDLDDFQTVRERLASDPRVPWGAGSIRISPDAVHFVPYRGEPLPHPNTLVLQALQADRVVFEETLCSVGGGFITNAALAGKELSRAATVRPPHPFQDATTLRAQAQALGGTIGDVVLANERAHGIDVEAGLDRIWDAFRACIGRGLDTVGELPGGLGVMRRASDLLARVERGAVEPAYQHIARAQAYAFAVNEENAAGGRVVTAPTNGAAGVLPGVLVEVAERMRLPREHIHNALATAGAIAKLVKTHASISGAEVGCQGEVGTATAMAAAALCQVLGGSLQQVENAAEIAIEHNLGLTCDPIRGLVQAPCIERNAMGVAKAWSAAQLSLHSTIQAVVSFDRVVKVMKRTGDDMRREYKETSEGGLAVNLPEC